MKKLLVTTLTQSEKDEVRNCGAELLAEYPDAMLVRADEAAEGMIAQRGIEAAPIESEIVPAPAHFAMASAVAADSLQPINFPSPSRTAYFFVQLIGPAKPEWTQRVRELGSIHRELPGFVLLVGMAPNRVTALQNAPWVEAVTPYRPAMKISSSFHEATRAPLSSRQLAFNEISVQPTGMTQPIQVEVSVFAGESTEEVASRVRELKGQVLSQTARAVRATIPATAVAPLAEQSGVSEIKPFAFPKFLNDRAITVMAVPVNRNFGAFTLNGQDQLVAVADSGLDTGNLATVHPDIRGRVVNLTSFPFRNAFLASLAHTPLNHDDGTDDSHSAHGTHVSGSILGDGTMATAAGAGFVPTGIAPGARLYFQAVEQKVQWKSLSQLHAEGLTPPFTPWPPEEASLWGLPDDLTDLFQAAYNAGARIHSNSWGSPDNGAYTDNSRQVDDFCWKHRDFLILFAAGNDGVDGASDGIIDLGSVGSPGTAKNCLTVGATENDRPPGSIPQPGIDANWDQLGNGLSLKWPALGASGHVSDRRDGMAAFSSRGPTAQGRLKPDVVAPGTNILSTRSSVVAGVPLWGDLQLGEPLRGKYCWSGGTSMSTPLVAGAAALVRQYLVEERGHVAAGSKPSGALIKAMIVHSCKRIDPGQFMNEIPSGPNNVSGFGLVDLSEIFAPGANLLFDDEPDHAVSNMQIQQYQLVSVSSSRPLKVTLVWTDAASADGNLFNKLYLQVVPPDGHILNAQPGTFVQPTNNVQQVLVPVPSAGTYIVRVRGISVMQHSPGVSASPASRQDFALVASGGTQLNKI